MADSIGIGGIEILNEHQRDSKKTKGGIDKSNLNKNKIL
jgi:hypothetical protein